MYYASCLAEEAVEISICMKLLVLCVNNNLPIIQLISIPLSTTN